MIEFLLKNTKYNLIEKLRYPIVSSDAIRLYMLTPNEKKEL